MRRYGLARWMNSPELPFWTTSRGPCPAQARAAVPPHRRRHAAARRPAQVGVPAGRRWPGRPRIADRHAGAAPAGRRRLPDLAIRPAGVSAGRRDLPPGAHRPGAQEQPERTGTVPGGGTGTARPSPARSRRRGRLFDAAVSAGGHGRQRRRAACTPRSARLRGGGPDLAAAPPRRARDRRPPATDLRGACNRGGAGHPGGRGRRASEIRGARAEAVLDWAGPSGAGQRQSTGRPRWAHASDGLRRPVALPERGATIVAAADSFPDYRRPVRSGSSRVSAGAQGPADRFGIGVAQDLTSPMTTVALPPPGGPSAQPAPPAPGPACRPSPRSRSAARPRRRGHRS